MLTIALRVPIYDAESCLDNADFGRDREALLREFLELPAGSAKTPIRDCSGR